MNIRVLIVRIMMLSLILLTIALFLYSSMFWDMVYRKKSISILAWPTELDASYLAEFEHKTGIKVHINYLENNEELLAKLRLNDTHGYDLVMVSDYMIAHMRELNLLKPIHKKQFQHWDQLYTELLDQYYDPGNEYTIPYFWDVYGLAIDTSRVCKDKARRFGWGLVFNPLYVPGRIGMMEDRRELILLAAMYLYNTIDGIDTQERRHEIVQLLRSQKQWVEMYTDMRSSALIASGVCPAAVTISTDVIRAQQQHSALAFVLPDTGSFMIIDNFAISTQSKKEEYVYQFLNYLYDKSCLQQYADKYMMRTAHRMVRASAITDTMVPDKQFFSQLSFFKNVIEEKRLNQLWISVVS